MLDLCREDCLWSLNLLYKNTEIAIEIFLRILNFINQLSAGIDETLRTISPYNDQHYTKNKSTKRMIFHKNVYGFLRHKKKYVELGLPDGTLYTAAVRSGCLAYMPGVRCSLCVYLPGRYDATAAIYHPLDVVVVVIVLIIMKCCYMVF